MTLKEELFCKTASLQVTFSYLGPPSSGQGLISATLRRDGCVQWSGWGSSQTWTTTLHLLFARKLILRQSLKLVDGKEPNHVWCLTSSHSSGKAAWCDLQMNLLNFSFPEGCDQWAWSTAGLAASRAFGKCVASMRLLPSPSSSFGQTLPHGLYALLMADPHKRVRSITTLYELP